MIWANFCVPLERRIKDEPHSESFYNNRLHLRNCTRDSGPKDDETIRYGVSRPRDTPYSIKTIQFMLAKARLLQRSSVTLAWRLLADLEKRQPGSIDVKREMADLALREGLFDAAAMRAFFIFLKTGEDSDLKTLVAASVYSTLFGLFFRDIQVHKKSKCVVLLQCIDELLGMKYFCLSGSIEDTCRAWGSMNGPMASEDGFTTMKSHKRRADKNQATFGAQHAEALILIKEGRVAAGLEILRRIFHQKTYVDLMNMLEQNERVVALHALKCVFSTPFLRVEAAQKRAKARILFLILKRERVDLLSDVASIL